MSTQGMSHLVEWHFGADISHHKIYKDATLFFSQDQVLSIANIIPTMDHIDALLRDTTISNCSLHL
jgi:hypothetical protein